VPSQGGFPASDKRLDASLDENFQLLDYAGGQDRSGKRGFIPDNLPPILLRLGIAPQEFLDTVEMAVLFCFLIRIC
jgi:hypothetical protein